MVYLIFDEWSFEIFWRWLNDDKWKESVIKVRKKFLILNVWSIRVFVIEVLIYIINWWGLFLIFFVRFIFLLVNCNEINEFVCRNNGCILFNKDIKL